MGLVVTTALRWSWAPRACASPSRGSASPILACSGYCGPEPPRGDPSRLHLSSSHVRVPPSSLYDPRSSCRLSSRAARGWGGALDMRPGAVPSRWTGGQPPLHFTHLSPLLMLRSLDGSRGWHWWRCRGHAVAPPIDQVAGVKSL